MYQQTLYQIGTLPVFQQPPVYLDGAIEIAAEPLLFAGHDRIRFPTEPISRSSPKQYSVEIRLFSNSLFTQSQYLSTLKSFVRRRIDLFSYVDLDDMPEVVFSGDEDPRGSEGLIWFHTRGVIQNITPTTDPDTGETTVSVQFFTDTYWMTVNRIQWMWRAGQFNPFNTVTTATIAADVNNYISTYPDRVDIEGVHKHGRIWAKRPITNGTNDLDWMLTQTLWDDIVANRSWAKPPVGYSGTFSAGDDDEFVIDQGVYSGGAASYYTMLMGSGGFPYIAGTMTITIESVIDGFTIKTEEITLDIARLNLELSELGYGGNDDTDRLYFGAWDIQPGFIVRGNDIITVRPAISYTGDFAGQLKGYQNTIIVGQAGVTLAPNFLTYLHILRRE